MQVESVSYARYSKHVDFCRVHVSFAVVFG